MWVAFAYADSNRITKCNADAYCYRGAKVYSDTKATSNTAASAVRPPSSGRFFGDSRLLASPRLAYFF